MDKDRKEIDFARRLADPNKTKRDRALKKLNEWLAFQSSKPPGKALARKWDFDISSVQDSTKWT